MDRNLIHRQIQDSLDTISEQHREIKTHSGKIPDIELDILLTGIQKLYESCKLLNKVSPISAVTEAVSQQVKTEAVPHLTQNVAAEEKAEPQPVYNDAPSESLMDIIPEEPVIVAASSEIVMEHSEFKLSSAVSEPIKAKQSERSLADMFTQNKTDGSLAGRMQRKPIADLKQAIGMNEKFTFINKLFSTNAAEYANCIDSLNHFSTINEAQQYLKESIIPRFNWDMESQHVSDFMELVERRFQKAL